MISLEKWYILTTLQKLPKNDGDLGQSIVAKGFKKLPKVQNIAQSDHTDQLDQGLNGFAAPQRGGVVECRSEDGLGIRCDVTGRQS